MTIDTEREIDIVNHRIMLIDQMTIFVDIHCHIPIIDGDAIFFCHRYYLALYLKKGECISTLPLYMSLASQVIDALLDGASYCLVSSFAQHPFKLLDHMVMLIITAITIP